MSTSLQALHSARAFAYDASLKAKSKGNQLTQRVNTCVTTFISHLKSTFANIKQECNKLLSSFTNLSSRQVIDITAMALITLGVAGLIASTLTLNVPGAVLSTAAIIAGLGLMGKEV